MVIEENPYEGIFFFPDVGRFSAAVANGRHQLVIAYSDSLQEAIDARTRHIAAQETRKAHE